MGLLDKLWDDVVAGPQPDQGLGRLRRKPKISEEGMDDKVEAGKTMAERRRSGEFYGHQEYEARRRVTSQSIAIANNKRPPLLRTASLDPDYFYNSGSAPSTPGAPSTPPSASSVESPYACDSETVRTSTVFHAGSNKVMWKANSEKFDKQAPNSPTVYDWIVLSALDR